MYLFLLGIFKDNLFSFYIVIPGTTSSLLPFHFSLYPILSPIHSSELVRFPLGSQWTLTLSSPLYIEWARYPSKEDVLIEASSNGRGKSWSHCQWLTENPHSVGLVWFFALSPEWVSSDMPNLIWSWRFSLFHAQKDLSVGNLHALSLDHLCHTQNCHLFCSSLILTCHN